MNTPNIKTSTVFSLKPIPKIPGLPKIATGNALLTDTSILKPRELVPGLLHQGTKGVLAGASKAGKTWILLALGLCIATGTPFLHWITVQGKVLFVNLELQAAFIKDRLVALMECLGIKNSAGLDIWNLRGKTADFETLVANIIKEAEGKDYALIILDPIYKAMIGKSENTASGVGLLCNQLERIAERTGAAVVYSHHFAKGNSKKKTPMDRMSGSGVFARDADTILALTEHSEPECYTVEMILRNLPKQPSFVVEWDYPVMVEREDLDPEDVQIEEVEDEDDRGLLQIIKVRPHTTGEWQIKAVVLGLSRATFYRIKAKLKDGGLITFDEKTKKWSVAGAAGGETSETSETSETAETDGNTPVSASTGRTGSERRQQP